MEIERMSIDDPDKAAEYLMDIGYYRLGFYWYYFQPDVDSQGGLEEMVK